MANGERNSSEPLIIIPAAGESSRFKAEGYHTPKPFLRIRKADGTTDYMLRHVLRTLPPGVEVHVIVRRDMAVPEGSFGGAEFVYIEGTHSHPETVLYGLPYDKRRILCLDCDMLLTPPDVATILDDQLHDAVVGVTNSWNPGLARVDSVEHPRVFADLPQISPWSIISARSFLDARKLHIALTNAISQRAGWPAPTMSHVLNLYPGVKRAVVLSEFTDWGTPEAVRQSGAVIL